MIIRFHSIEAFKVNVGQNTYDIAKNIIMCSPALREGIVIRKDDQAVLSFLFYPFCYELKIDVLFGLSLLPSRRMFLISQSMWNVVPDKSVDV